MSSMGENIRELRLKHKMTQEQLGAHLGVQKSAIRKYESGMVENIPRSSIKKMAELFGVKPSALMGWEEEQTKNDAVADIILRMRRDEVFLEAVSIIYGYDEDKLTGLLTLIK